MKNIFLARLCAAAGMSLALLCGTAGATDFAGTLAEAEKGNTSAMHNVGVLYASGSTGKEDFPQAMTWFLRAALQGNYNSMYSLGIMYRFGQGVDVDMVQAGAWYALAAEFIPRQGDEWLLPPAKVAMYGRTADEISKGLNQSQRAQARSRADALREQIAANLRSARPAAESAR